MQNSQSFNLIELLTLNWIQCCPILQTLEMGLKHIKHCNKTNQPLRKRQWICVDRMWLLVNIKKSSFLCFLFCFYFLVGFFWLHHVVCGILVPRPGIESGSLSVQTPNPNHWMAREFPKSSFSRCVSQFLWINIQISELVQ